MASKKKKALKGTTTFPVASVEWAAELGLSHLSTALSDLVRKNYRGAAVASSCAKMYFDSAAEMFEEQRRRKPATSTGSGVEGEKR